MKTNRLLATLMLALLVIGSAAGVACAGETPAVEPAGEEYFAQWNADAPALNALVEYVEAVTDPNSPDYIPEPDRIAVFDMDGTLMGELYPTYLEYYMLAWRILKDPDCHPDAEMLEVGRLLRDCALDNSFPPDMAMRHAVQAARAYAGMTLSEFSDFVTRILVREVDGFEGMTYSRCFYLPMVEVVEYLQDNGFTCYVCSGSDRFICRVFIEGMLDIPYNNVIGMDVQLETTGQGDEVGLDHTFSVGENIVRTDQLLIKNLKTNKVLQIAQEIGQQPVLSFGNSSGDTSMHNYVIGNNAYKSAAFMLVADDDKRDYGNPEKAAGLKDKWQAAGYHVISMANDWKTIYGEEVVKTGKFRWMEELAENRVPVVHSVSFQDPVGTGAVETAPAAEPAGETQFAQWNADAPALSALVEYVEAVTDPNSPDFIPEKDRIATFDMDGTLMGELFPTYLEVALLTERILADPSWTPDEEMLEFGRMTRDHALDKSFPSDYDYEFSHHQARAFAGMTLQEYADFIAGFLKNEADGFEGMTYGNAYYKPMAEVIGYLQENGFKCFIVSGSDRFIIRSFVDGILDIPNENIIGSDTALAARDQGDTDGIEYVFADGDEVVRTDKLLIKDLKTNKVLQIAQEIGQQPVLSFGNSGGDVSMNNYALLNNRYRSAAFMLVADDDARDYGDPARHDELTAKWQGMGYQVISMRDDWKTIYGEDVKKTGQFRWLEKYADRNIAARGGDIADKYTLEQVVVLSRHNLRAPLSSNGSVPQELTPHAWIQWSSASSELTLLGGVEEVSMGQYFRKWLAGEGLIPENTVPEAGTMRFYARDKQRCRATARYFAAGMLPLADIEVEHPGDAKGSVDFMAPVLHYYSDEYAADATAEVAAMGGDAGFDGIAEQNRDVIRLIMDTVDMRDSEGYKSGKFGELLTDGFGFTVEAGKEPDLAGAVKPAYQVADALLLQYYEEPDAVKAAFGHQLSEEDWARLGKFMTTCLEMKHGARSIAANINNPLLRELEGELRNKDRRFTFFCAHDCTVLGAIAALGAQDFALPGSIETKTPIGVKLVFERRRDAAGQAWYRVSLVYRSTEQIRSGEMLTLDNPPLRYDLRFEGVATNADGLIAEADLFDLFDRSISILDGLEAEYAADKAA